MRRFKKILIANRGEIACRIHRTTQKLGIAAAGVHSSADRLSLAVRTIGESIEVGGPAPADSYLNIPAILDAAKRTGADAIHPGFGFLSENPAFVRAVEAAGLVFIGPTAETMEALGDKARGKLAAKAAGLPVVPGVAEPSSDAAHLARLVRQQKLPVLLKAVAGGGGRGMALIETLQGDQLEERILSAMGEARRSFGSADLIIERYLPNVRHIEVQIAGDGRGGAIHLFERECSLQRRHQKVIEEAPAPNLDGDLREKLLQGARQLAAACRYRNLGTVEFIVDGREFYFLEVNPRLQVEHPVTEEITGLDLVELQIMIAAEARLPFAQSRVSVRGHAIEARLYAEDPDRDFMPSPGRASLVSLPKPPVRVDSGIESGDAIEPYYDPMIAKIITHGASRADALNDLQTALRLTHVAGVATNAAFLLWLLGLDEVAAARMHTRLIDEKMMLRKSLASETGAGAASPVVVGACAAFWLSQKRDAQTHGAWSRWGEFTGFRSRAGDAQPSVAPALVLSEGDRRHEVRFSGIGDDGVMIVAVADAHFRVGLTALGQGRFLAQIDGQVFDIWCELVGDTLHYRSQLGSGQFAAAPYLEAAVAATVVDRRLTAPMMGRIARVNGRDGDRVAAGDIVVVMDSMKMELRVSAPCDGVLRGLSVKVDDMVERGHLFADVIDEGAD